MFSNLFWRSGLGASTGLESPKLLGDASTQPLPWVFAGLGKRDGKAEREGTEQGRRMRRSFQKLSTETVPLVRWIADYVPPPTSYVHMIMIPTIGIVEYVPLDLLQNAGQKGEIVLLRPTPYAGRTVWRVPKQNETFSEETSGDMKFKKLLWQGDKKRFRGTYFRTPKRTDHGMDGQWGGDGGPQPDLQPKDSSPTGGAHDTLGPQLTEVEDRVNKISWHYLQGDFAQLRVIQSNHENFAPAGGNPVLSFTFHGRSDEVLNIAGIRLGTEELEDALLSMKTVVKQAVVIGASCSLKGVAPVAFVVRRRGQEGREEEGDVIRDLQRAVAATVRNRVGAFAIPQAVVLVHALPVTFSGKFCRGLLSLLWKRCVVVSSTTLERETTGAGTLRGETSSVDGITEEDERKLTESVQNRDCVRGVEQAIQQAVGPAGGCKNITPGRVKTSSMVESVVGKACMRKSKQQMSCGQLNVVENCSEMDSDVDDERTNFSNLLPDLPATEATSIPKFPIPPNQADPTGQEGTPMGIHPTAVVAPDVLVSITSDEVSIAEYVVIKSGVRLGRGTKIGPFCVLEKNVVIQSSADHPVLIGPHCVLGQDCKIKPGTKLLAHCVIGPNTLVGRDCTVHSHCVLGQSGHG